MLKVITTVGTSVFGNYRKFNKDDDIKLNYLNRPFKDRNEERSDKEKAKVRRWTEELSDKSQISAEIKSLLKIKEAGNDDLEVYLLATDTVASYLAAEIVKEVLEKEGIKVCFDPEVDVIRDLQVDDFKKFERGKDNLIRRISQLIDEFSKDKKKDKKRKYIRDNVIFNVTGGYKGVIPLLTILAQLYECEIFYIFENSDDSITIPRIPINFDAFLLESLYVDIYLKKQNPSHNFRNQKKLREFGFINQDNEVTALGELFYDMAYTYNPMSPNVLGYFVEYKILKYLYNKGEKFMHSYKYKYKKDGKDDDFELDFVFDRGPQGWEVWEVKSMGSFLNSEIRDEIIGKLEKQLSNVKEMKAYKVIVYSITDDIKDELKKQAKDIANMLRTKFPSMKVQFDFLHLKGMKGKEQGKVENPYQALFKESIKDEHFKELV